MWLHEQTQHHAQPRNAELLPILQNGKTTSFRF
jgi:hypothetical protein